MGKIADASKLGLPEPDATLTRGEQHVARQRRAPQSGSSRCSRATPGARASSPTGCSTTSGSRRPRMRTGSPAAATELLVPEPFLRELQELLHGEGAGDLLRPAGHGQDLPRRPVRGGAPARPGAADAGAVPPVDVLRGLLRGLPAAASTSAGRCTTSCGLARWR